LSSQNRERCPEAGEHFCASFCFVIRFLLEGTIVSESEKSSGFESKEGLTFEIFALLVCYAA
jgi:hypothetical protein